MPIRQTSVLRLAQLWIVPRCTTVSPALTLPLASDDTRAYAVADDGSVMAISGANGGTVWKVLPPRGLSGALRLDAAPAVVEGRLFVGLGAAGLRALNPEDGETLWQKRIGEVVGFLAVGDRLYVLSAEGTMAALQASTGAVQWQQTLKLKPTGGPWLARGLLWVAAEGDVLAAVDPQDGTETWRTKLPSPLKGGVSDDRELVLVPTNGREGRLLGLRPGQREPVIDVHVDSALRTEPRVLGDDVLVKASDGRVLAWQIKRTSR